MTFPPIADYAFLSDCETSCLIAPGGAVEWMCAPRPDSPSVFGALLDRAAGSLHLNPWGVQVPAAVPVATPASRGGLQPSTPASNLPLRVSPALGSVPAKP